MINKDTYKRLTYKNKDEFAPEYYFCVDCEYFGEPNGCNRWGGTCANYEQFNELYNRLAELEDKIMDGTLVQLPCKVGDKVFLMAKYNNNIYVGDYFLVEKIGFDKFGFYVETDKGIFRKEQIFLTKAEAEARLKELQEKEQ